MKLYAISDLHLGNPINKEALGAIPPFPNDWLILAGDVGETEANFHYALELLTKRFARVLWAPGNHDLWTLPSDTNKLRGEAKYQQLVSICRNYGVLTPEDPYILWPGPGPACLLAPLFILYDYTFRPDHVSADSAIEWAVESGVLCTDEALLHPDPYPSRAAWCAARCAYTEKRLEAASLQAPLLLINHFPLRQDLVRLGRIPRFSLWCGTRLTEEWHRRFPALAVIYGHLHIRATDYRNGVRFEEVSLGYPSQWRYELGVQAYFREILPELGMPR
jgi:3',5'-cyclic AMP phosphodiesterase CpdA